jgi:membrane protein DedA with SNARE-associated domain
MGLKDWVLSIMEQLGYLGIALLMFLDNVFPPVPSEIIMPSAG